MQYKIARTAVLGLDALSWEYLNKLIANGVVPNISRYVQKGVRASVFAFPPVTPPSWASIMTGVNPGKHGIFGFFKYIKTERGWKQELFTANDLRYPRLHEKLSLLGIETFTVNPIPDYPVIPVPGATIISNMFFTPRPVSYPEEAILKYFGSKKDYVKGISSKGCKVIEDYIEVVNDHIEAAEKAVKEEYKLIWINLIIPDKLFHECPKMITSSKISSAERRLFSLVDELAKVLRENSDNFIIVSDHGFSKYTKLISVNDILAKEGLLKTTKEKYFKNFRDFDKKTEKKEIVLDINLALIKILKKTRVKQVIGPLVRWVLYHLLRKELSIYSGKWPDPENSLAFLPDNNAFGIILNDGETIKKKILRILKEKYNEIMNVYDKKEIFHGQYLDIAPDIFIIPNYSDGYWIYYPTIVGELIVESENFYYHHPLGVFILDSDSNEVAKNTDLGVINNFIVGNIVNCVTGAPMDKSRDMDREVEKKVCWKSLDEFNYLARWAVSLRIIRGRWRKT